MVRRPPSRPAPAAPSLQRVILAAATSIVLGACPSSAQEKSGPTAAVSLGRDAAYSTARACAAGCLVYSGVFQCGVNAGYQDLGVGLGCGCGPLNACYCAARLASSAASYITSCVSDRCARSVAAWRDEAASMQGLYDGYCRTANADAPAATTAAASRGTGAGSTPAANAGGDGLPTPTTTVAGGGAQGGGLSQSDVIALAASLGVGVPSLLVATATLWVQMRKKKKKEAAAAAAETPAAPSPVVVQPEAAHKPVEVWTPSPSPHISEAP